MGGHGDDIEKDLKKARVLAWISIVYLSSNLVVLFVVMSGSQALKSEWVGDALSLIAPALFLIGDKISAQKPSPSYPYGFERAVSAGYLGSALALLAVGGYLFVDGGKKLLMQEHPSIGGLPIFGQVVWIGWLAIPALLWSSVPAFFLGRAKKKLGEKLHDKTLLADAETNAADWQSASAAMIGVLGIAFGIWWLDAAAALFISFEILRSGFSEVRTALGDILDRRPHRLDNDKPEDLPDRLTQYLQREDWVEDAIVRIRERGREFSAEAFVIPANDRDVVDQINRCASHARDMDPRLREISIVPVREFPPELERVRANAGDG